MTVKPNIKSVAEGAGVSPSSVSNAYNRPERLSAPVRERIFAVAAAQGYAGPDPAARSLRSRRAGAIGVLLTTQLSYAFSDPYCVELLDGVAEVADETGTGLLLIPLVPHTAPLDAEETRRSVEAVRHALVDGVVADGIGDRHPALDIVAKRGLPLVRSTDDGRNRCVVVDDRAGGATVGAHLAALGHRSVAVLADSPDAPGTVTAEVGEGVLYPYARLRVEGLRRALPADADVRVIAGGRNATASGHAAAATALGARPQPTALVAMSDVLALGALQAVRARRLEPGRDVSITGFDDVSAAAAAGLTTVRQPIREKGVLMARMLLDPSYSERLVVLPTELVPRSSTAPAPRSTTR
jgi:DNA-binding LacI/PurR family transcriptional regulator